MQYQFRIHRLLKASQDYIRSSKLTTGCERLFPFQPGNGLRLGNGKYCTLSVFLKQALQVVLSAQVFSCIVFLSSFTNAVNADGEVNRYNWPGKSAILARSRSRYFFR